MRIVPTVRVSDGSGGSIVINEADFDPVVHQRVDEPPGVASPEPVAQDPAPRRSAKGVAWTASEAEQKRRALLQATRLLDAHVVWTGYAASTGQALSWPRDGMCDRNDYGLDAGVIPPALRDATAEFARHLLHATDDRTANSAVVSSGIRELVAGSVELTFTSDRPDVIPDAVWFLLVPSWMARVRQRSTRTASAVPVVRT